MIGRNPDGATRTVLGRRNSTGLMSPLMKITDQDILRILERVREYRYEITSGEIVLTPFEVDVIITSLEIAGGV